MLRLVVCRSALAYLKVVVSASHSFETTLGVLRVSKFTGTNVYKCDHDCLMFKSTNGMCSHSLLASSLNDQTEAYVRQYTKKPLPEIWTRTIIDHIFSRKLTQMYGKH